MKKMKNMEKFILTNMKHGKIILLKKPINSTANYYIVVELSNGKYDFAKWSAENETWTNQNGKILVDVVKWREFNRQVI